MTTYRQEFLCECVREAMPLIEQHHRELMPHAIPLDPCWDDYALLERLGRFVVFTARREGALVGYSAFHVARHLQSGGFPRAINEVFYVAPEHRRGTVPLGFLRFSHARLKELGARHIAYAYKASNNLGAILHRLGFADEERVAGILT